MQARIFARYANLLSPSTLAELKRLADFAEKNPNLLPELFDDNFTDDHARSLNLRVSCLHAFERNLKRDSDPLRLALLELYCAASMVNDWQSFRRLNRVPAQTDDAFVRFQDEMKGKSKSSVKYAASFERTETEVLAAEPSEFSFRNFSAPETLGDYITLIDEVLENETFRVFNFKVGQRMYSGAMWRRLQYLTGLPYGQNSYQLPWSFRAFCVRSRTEDTDREAVARLFSQHLLEEKNLSSSSACHYRTGLNRVNRFLLECPEDFKFRSIYEPETIEELWALRDAILSHPQFVELNTAGHRMYSSALNHYVDFIASQEPLAALPDAPQPVPAKKPPVERAARPARNIIVNQALAHAGWTCEYDRAHATFETESGVSYAEGHHLIPVYLQPRFDVGLHVWANIVCLCPICHRQMHYGRRSDRQRLFGDLYDRRRERLFKSGIRNTKDELLDMVLD